MLRNFFFQVLINFFCLIVFCSITIFISLCSNRESLFYSFLSFGLFIICCSIITSFVIIIINALTRIFNEGLLLFPIQFSLCFTFTNVIKVLLILGLLSGSLAHFRIWLLFSFNFLLILIGGRRFNRNLRQTLNLNIFFVWAYLIFTEPLEFLFKHILRCRSSIVYSLHQSDIVSMFLILWDEPMNKTICQNNQSYRRS